MSPESNTDPTPGNLYQPAREGEFMEIASAKLNGVLYSDRLQRFRGSLAEFVSQPPTSTVEAARSAITRRSFRLGVCGPLGDNDAIEETNAALHWFVEKADEIDPKYAMLLTAFRGPRLRSHGSFLKRMWAHIAGVLERNGEPLPGVGRASVIDPLDHETVLRIGGTELYVAGFHPAADRPELIAPQPMLAWFPLTQFKRLPVDQQYERAREFLRVRRAQRAEQSSPTAIAPKPEPKPAPKPAAHREAKPEPAEPVRTRPQRSARNR